MSALAPRSPSPREAGLGRGRDCRPSPRHGPLFWRIYLHGVMLLVVVAVAVAAVGWVLRQSGGWGPGGAPAQYAASRIGELVGDPPALARELVRVRDTLGVEASVYAADGRLVATSRQDGAPNPAGPRFGWHVPLQGGATLVVHSSAPHEPTRGLLFIGAVLVALALGSFPLARSIAAPIERLTAARWARRWSARGGRSRGRGRRAPRR